MPSALLHKAALMCASSPRTYRTSGMSTWSPAPIIPSFCVQASAFLNTRRDLSMPRCLSAMTAPPLSARPMSISAVFICTSSAVLRFIYLRWFPRSRKIFCAPRTSVRRSRWRKNVLSKRLSEFYALCCAPLHH